MDEKKTIVKASFWSFSSSILTKLLSFVYTIIIARLVAQDDIGAFYLVLSVLGILYIFTDLGLAYSLNRYIPYLHSRQEFAKLRNLIKLSYLGGGFLTLIFSIATFFLAGNISTAIGQPNIKPILEIMAIWLLVKEIDDVNRGILSGRKRILESQVLDVVQNFAKIILTGIAFYMIGFNAEALSWGYLISFMLILPIGLYLAIKEIDIWKNDNEDTKIKLKDQIELGKEVITFGIVLTLISTLWVVIQSTDKILIAYFSKDSLAQVAVYSIAIGLANLILLFPSAISGIFFPLISEMHGQDKKEEITKITATSIKWTIMLMTPITIVMSIFGGELLALFYGGKYSAGGVVLILFVLGLFIRSIFSFPSIIFAAMRRLDIEIKAAGSAAIINIILNILFIPIWGINGAALASLIAFIVLGIVLWYYSKKVFNFEFPKEAYKPLIAGIMAFLIIFLLKDQILSAITQIPEIQIGESQGQIADEVAQKLVKLIVFGALFLVSCIMYFIAMLTLRVFSSDEIEILDAGLKRIGVPERYRKTIGKILEAKYLGTH
jgi:O-antigen/teichoic acid export membrane protein